MERKRNELTDSRATVQMIDTIDESNRIQIGNGKVKKIKLQNFQREKSYR